MASRHSPSRNGSAMRREHVQRLLRNGVIISAPEPELLATAGQLEQLGLIQVQPTEFVRCADPQDADFSRTNRHCRGRVYLSGPLQDLRCPECERRVFPDADRKRRHQEVRIEVLAPGVLAYVFGLLEKERYERTPVCGGVLRVNSGPLGVLVCVVDYCEDPKFLAREWASTQPTCYIAVNPLAAERFLDEAWLRRVGLAELLCGETDLAELVEKTALSGPPAVIRLASIPICSRTSRPRCQDGREKGGDRRLFVVELDEGVVRVEGQRVVAAQAVTRYQVFRALWERFVEDLGQGRRVEDFRATDMETILCRLQAVSDKEVVDEVSIRRAINRLQTDIMEAIRRVLGLPIQRDDVVETCRWKGQASAEHGYRLNPRRVAVRPASS